MTRPLQLVPVYSDYDLDNLTAICQAAVDECEDRGLGADEFGELETDTVSEGVTQH